MCVLFVVGMLVKLSFIPQSFTITPSTFSNYIFSVSIIENTASLAKLFMVSSVKVIYIASKASQTN